MKRLLMAIAAGLAVASSGLLGFAGPITVPNGSFELPATGFVSVDIDSWQKPPKPDWYVESGGFFWTQLTGIFQNPAPTSPDHIDNCDGNQAIWLFVVPEVGLFQDYDTVDWNNPAPTHAFDATYEAGKSYHLTVGVIGTGGGMQQGATLESRLYYRDAASNRVAVAVTSITNTTAIFSNNTQLIDFQVHVPTVTSNDTWMGKHIGIELRSTITTTNLEGGYWDLDNVRLAAIEEPTLRNPVWTNGQFQFTLKSEPGIAIEVVATAAVATPIGDWTPIGILTNSTGSVILEDAVPDSRRFYRARRLSP